MQRQRQRKEEDEAEERNVAPHLIVNFDHGFAISANMAAIHARGIKRQGDISISIDRDQSAASAELCDLIECALRGIRQRRTAIFHQRGNFVTGHGPDEIFSVTRRGRGAGAIVCISSRADDRGIADAARFFVGISAGVILSRAIVPAPP
jgi:hypothetical protein